MKPLHLAVTVAMTCLVAVTACTRGEEEKVADRGPIQERVLPTPRSQARPGVVLSGEKAAATPLPAHTPAPGEAPEVTPSPEATAPPAAEAPATPAEPAAPAGPRKGVVARGTDIRTGPTGDSPILGTFQGRTNVEVVSEEGGFAQVRAPVIGGGSVEGWVAASAVSDPAKVAAAPKPKAPSAPSAPGAPAKPAAPAPAPKKAAAPGDKGPDNILLVPIAGTAKKRPATPFTHKAHYDDYGYGCEICHHPVDAQGGSVPSYSCSSAGCHLANECNGQAVGKNNDACPNFEDAYHTQCIDCHKQDGGPTRCGECHTG